MSSHLLPPLGTGTASATLRVGKQPRPFKQNELSPRFYLDSQLDWKQSSWASRLNVACYTTGIPERGSFGVCTSRQGRDGRTMAAETHRATRVPSRGGCGDGPPKGCKACGRWNLRDELALRSQSQGLLFPSSPSSSDVRKRGAGILEECKFLFSTRFLKLLCSFKRHVGAS